MGYVCEYSHVVLETDNASNETGSIWKYSSKDMVII